MAKYQPKTKPFPHQSRAVVRATKARNHALFFEPRLGKSKAALDWVGVLALKGEISRVLIVAPRIAVKVWEQQIPMHFPYGCTVENFEEEWSHPQGGEPQGTHPQVAFFLAGREETFRATRVNGKLRRPKQSQLESWRPDAIIFDESHQYQRPGGRGAQDAWRMVTRLRVAGRGSGRPYVLLLSGTPNPRGWRSLFAQFRIMDPTVFGTAVADFDDRYVQYGHGKRRFTILRYKREEEILRRVRRHSVSVSADEAGLAGVRMWNPLWVNLPAGARRAYDELVEEFMTEVEGGIITAKNAGVLRLRLLQVTGGFTTEGKTYHREKVDAVREYVRLLQEQGEPYIVGCRFTPEVHATLEALGKFSRCEAVHGETRRGRDLAIKAFQRGSLDGLVFQVQAGAAAIELARAAELVFYSFPDGWVEFKQFGDRVLGPNQHRPVRYTPILAKDTLDKSVVRGLRRKEEWHDTLMDNPRAFLQGLS